MSFIHCLELQRYTKTLQLWEYQCCRIEKSLLYTDHCVSDIVFFTLYSVTPKLCRFGNINVTNWSIFLSFYIQTIVFQTLSLSSWKIFFYKQTIHCLTHIVFFTLHSITPKLCSLGNMNVTNWSIFLYTDHCLSDIVFLTLCMPLCYKSVKKQPIHLFIVPVLLPQKHHAAHLTHVQQQSLCSQ